MTNPIAGYLTGMLTLTFPAAEPVEIGSVSLPVGVTTGPGGITTRLIVDTEQAARDIRAIFAASEAIEVEDES